MKNRVEILPDAWEDLKKIEDYYILQFDVQTALKVSGHKERTAAENRRIKKKPYGWCTNAICRG